MLFKSHSTNNEWDIINHWWGSALFCRNGWRIYCDANMAVEVGFLARFLMWRVLIERCSLHWEITTTVIKCNKAGLPLLYLYSSAGYTQCVHSREEREEIRGNRQDWSTMISLFVLSIDFWTFLITILNQKQIHTLMKKVLHKDGRNRK